MLIIEKKSLGDNSASQPKEISSEQAFYSTRGRVRGHGGQGQEGNRGCGGHQKLYDSNKSTQGRGNSRGAGGAREDARSLIWMQKVVARHVESQTILKETSLGKNKDAGGCRVIMHLAAISMI